MPQFVVNMPATIHLSILVEAPDAEAAEQAAFSKDYGLQIVGPECGDVEIVEWETHRHVAQGNVFSGVLCDISVDPA